MSVGQGHQEGSEELRKWLSGLKPVTGADTMLRFTKTPEGSIDLTQCPPLGAGPAAWPAARPGCPRSSGTGSSTWWRPGRPATSGPRSSSSPTTAASTPGTCPPGTVVWTSAVGGKPQRVSAPVMLTAISLTVRPGEDDFELQLTEQAHINPALVRHLKTVHGIVFDVNAVTRLAYSTARFDPQPVLDRLVHADPAHSRCRGAAQPAGLHLRRPFRQP